MPELPEVETVRRGLEGHVLDRRIAEVVVSGARTVRRHRAEELVAGLLGRSIRVAGRRGKYLVCILDDRSALVVHLRMSGQLVAVAPGPVPVALAPHTHARIVFEDTGELRFVDARTFGELFVTDELDELGVPLALAGLGPDPILDGIDPLRLARLAASRRTSLKTFLLDQSVLAGIGNLYADEACFRAGVRPTRPVASLRPIELRRLVAGIDAVLGEAIACGGSTLKDARYLDLLGSPGSYQDHHAVYGRFGEPCVTCGRPLQRVRLGGRSTHFCRSCQR